MCISIFEFLVLAAALTSRFHQSWGAVLDSSKTKAGQDLYNSEMSIGNEVPERMGPKVQILRFVALL